MSDNEITRRQLLVGGALVGAACATGAAALHEGELAAPPQTIKGAVPWREGTADVPTIAESGYPGFDAIAWHGILAPANTPPAIVSRLNAEIVKALRDPETATLLEKQAMQIIGNSPQAFADFIKQDIAVWKQVAGQAKVEVK